jgi:hypothetical protein
VYSTCIHCHAGLGSNESVEAFPTGRRLAFDHQSAERGPGNSLAVRLPGDRQAIGDRKQDGEVIEQSRGGEYRDQSARRHPAKASPGASRQAEPPAEQQ